MNHPGVVRLLGVYTLLPDLSIVLECVEGRSLHFICHPDEGGTGRSPPSRKGYCRPPSWASSLTSPFSLASSSAPRWGERPLEDVEEVLGLGLQIADAMDYVHFLEVVHRDLKPANVLVTHTGIVKLIDFGLAYLGDPSLIPAHSVFAGTPAYLPPEVLREEEATFKQDVYSFGILFWEMLAQEFPFDAMTLKQMTIGVTTRDLRPTIPSCCSPEIASFLQECWAPLPEQRPAFSEVRRLLHIAGAPSVPLPPKASFYSIAAM